MDDHVRPYSAFSETGEMKMNLFLSSLNVSIVG